MDSQAQSCQGPDNCSNRSGHPPSYTELGSLLPNYEAFNDTPTSPVFPFHRAQPQEVSALLDLNQRSPWWETEARTILLGQDFQSIKQILRFRLYGHKDSLRHVLQRRWECMLDENLAYTHPTKSKDDLQAVAELKKDQKVEEVLERVEPTRPISLVCWSWKPHKAADETDTERIAADIDEESCSLFRRVPFRGWLRHAIGYQEESVDQLFFQHDCLSRRLSWYLRRHPEETDKYVEVKKKLHNRSALACQALSHCLQSTPRRMTSSCLPFDVEAIIGRFRPLFQSRTLEAILNILPILAIRFNQTYDGVLDIDWRRKFRIEVDVFETVVAGISPEQLARKETTYDKNGFDLLCPAALKDRGPHLIYLNKKSDAITMEIAECCEAHPRLGHYFIRFAEELYHLRNWYRLPAVLQGLRRAGFDESVSPTLFNLINSDDNYAACRAQMKATPGLPFLFPYLKQYAHHGDAILAEVFSFASYSMEAVCAQSASSTGGFEVLRKFLACICR